MKRHKWARKQQNQRQKNPTRDVRLRKLIHYTQKVATRVHDRKNKGYWMFLSTDMSDLDHFGFDLFDVADEEMNVQWADVHAMFPIYKKCLKQLEAKEEFDRFVDEKYEPLEDGLFEI